jgi:hydroxyethylthiazole kinase-like uncharacterized protein yjeF
VYLVTAREMREIDRFTIEQVGIPANVLMENAGSFAALEIRKRFPSPCSVVVLAGHGNNGGDGMVLARYLANQGYEVEVWCWNSAKATEETKQQRSILNHFSCRVRMSEESDLDSLRASFSKADVIVDALLGTGGRAPLKEPYLTVVKVLGEWLENYVDSYVVALDLPTGMDPDTGALGEAYVRANLTIAFGYLKRGMVHFPGADAAGERVVVDLSFPREAEVRIPLRTRLVQAEDVKLHVPVRRRNSHKGTYGHTLIIGGSTGMTGAPSLAALAALRTGAGYTTIAAPSPCIPILSTKVTEAVLWSWDSTDLGQFTVNSANALKSRISDFKSVAIGPGIGVWDHGEDWLRNICRSSSCPVVIDADGLNLLSKDLTVLNQRQDPTILTPHPGEMARLLGSTVAEVENDRFQAALTFSKQHRCIVVLKGAYTITALPSGELFVNSTGNASLAKAGSGDVLTGMIASFLAQGLDPDRAAVLGVYLHGLAGQLATSDPMMATTLATDVIEHIREAFSFALSEFRSF